MICVFVVLLFASWCSPNSGTSAPEEELRRFRSRLQRFSVTPPNARNGAPVRVFAGIYVESMSNFQAAEMSFDVDLYLYTNWRDPSLNHSRGKEPVLINDPRVRERIWLPDLYFANAKSSKLHEVTAPNFNMFISADGQIASSTRVTMSVACNLDLARYPMDRQTCSIRMLSYAYVASQVNITWFSRKPTRYNGEIELPEFRIVSIAGEYCDGTYSYAIMEQEERRDQFSCLEAVILLERQLGYHMVQSYIPTALIVVVSWVSFWIDRTLSTCAAPARVTLSFTTMLTLSTLGNGMRFGLPQVSYAKAIDFWYGACMLFVFLNLTEYAAVNSYLVLSLKYEQMAKDCEEKQVSAKGQQKDKDAAVQPGAVPGEVEEHEFLLPNGVNRAELALERKCWLKLSHQYDRWSMCIDRWSRLLFPLAFLSWNSFYWAYYYVFWHSYKRANGD